VRGILFSRAQTLLIVAALLIPELLRSADQSLEPYPAIILPAGAGTIRIEHGTVPVSRTVLTARRNGDWQTVDVPEFMFPIASHYFTRIASRDFGFPRSKDASAQERENAATTKRWMRARLAAQGFATTSIRVVVEHLTIALPSGERVSTRVARKKTHELD
jgi:hypothetical protein